jgi:hypothetical protein
MWTAFGIVVSLILKFLYVERIDRQVRVLIHGFGCLFRVLRTLFAVLHRRIASLWLSVGWPVATHSIV